MAVAVGQHARETVRDGVTGALGAWLMVGLFLDGYMHNTRGGQLESFFTPWHGVLYSGFLAMALWITLPMLRAEGPLGARLAALPDGYAAGALGALIFALGGMADSVWHSVFGIEVDLEALLSPPHLVLLAGAMLMLTTPVRAMWRGPERAPVLRAFLPALASVTLATLLVGFFFMYASGLYDVHATGGFVRAFEPGGPLVETPFLQEVLTSFGVVARLLTTAILMMAALLVLRRWQPPFGTFTVLFTTYAAFMLVLDAFRRPALVLAGLAAGIAADLIAARLRPSPDRLRAVRVFSAVVPAVLWLVHFGVLAVEGDLGWPFVLWGGVVLFAAGTGYALSLLAVPPVVEPPPR